jgi:hypothetical protein
MNGCGSYIVENNLLYEVRDDRKLLVIPKGMQNELIRNAHNVGHFGVKKVVELLDKEYSISNVREKVERFIRNKKDFLTQLTKVICHYMSGT